MCIWQLLLYVDFKKQIKQQQIKYAPLVDSKSSRNDTKKLFINNITIFSKGKKQKQKIYLKWYGLVFYEY